MHPCNLKIMPPKVSIIIPVYNAGEYLRVCLDSLVNQTMTDIEIILILDKPTDGSDLVAEEYLHKDKRIKIIANEKNLHIGCSRNVGLKAAQGEYVGFADHDDYCQPEMFEMLYKNAVESQADVVVSDYCDENKNGINYFRFPTGLSEEEFQARMFDALISGRQSQPNVRTFDNVNVIWNQLFKREFLANNSITFSDNRILTMEDVLFNIKVHHFAKRVYYIPEAFYHHITNGQNEFQNYSYRAIDKVMPHLVEVFDFLVKEDLYQHFKKSFTICTLKRLYTSYRNEVRFKGILASFGFFEKVRSHSKLREILNKFKDNPLWKNELALTKRVFLMIVSK